MLIDTFDLAKISDGYWLLSWTATDLTKTCWVFVNGVLLDTYVDSSTLEREAYVSVERDTMVSIEIHEAASDVSVESIAPSIENDLLRWDRVDDAVYYNIYHREADLSERRIKKYMQEDTTEKYEFTLPVLNSTGGVWHHFRVESVNEWKISSERDQWHFFLYGLPPIATSVDITGGGGVFALRVII